MSSADVTNKPALKVVPEIAANSLKDAHRILPLSLKNIDYEVNGQRYLKDINLTIEDCEATVILGPNGAGKTLLLRTCHRLLRPTRGTLQWKNEKIARQPSSQAMVFQRPVMLRRSVRSNINYALKVCGVPQSEQHQRLNTALQSAGLSHLANRPAKKLSGGEQQRLALARAWAFRPQVMFLDEPAAHLDPGAARQIEEMLQQIQQSGTRIIMVTHDLGQARRIAKRVVFMYRGRVLENRSAEHFFHSPHSEEARAFIAGDLLW